MENQYIQVERNESGVVTITLNAPEHLNPWYIPMMEEMTTEVLRDEKDRRTLLRVVENYDVVLTAPVSGFLFTDTITE